MATRFGLNERTIQRMEATEGVPVGLSQYLNLVQRTLENGGVIFIDADEEGPGVRLRRDQAGQ